MSLYDDAAARLAVSLVLAPFAEKLLRKAPVDALARDAFLGDLLAASDRTVFLRGQKLRVMPSTMESPAAAAVLGVSVQRVRKACAEGSLVAFDFGDGRSMLVTVASVEAYQAKPHGRGRRRNCQKDEG